MSFPLCFENQIQFDKYLNYAKEAQNGVFDPDTFNFCCDCTYDYQEQMIDKEKCAYSDVYFLTLKSKDIIDINILSFLPDFNVIGIRPSYNNTLKYLKRVLCKGSSFKYPEKLYVSDLVKIFKVSKRILIELSNEKSNPIRFLSSKDITVRKNVLYKFLNTENGRLFLKNLTKVVEKFMNKTLTKLQFCKKVLYTNDLVKLLNVPEAVLFDLEDKDLYPGDINEDGNIYIHKATLFHFLRTLEGLEFIDIIVDLQDSNM